MTPYDKKGVLKNKYICSKCGKPSFVFNAQDLTPDYKKMYKDKVCWECIYWNHFFAAPPENLYVIDNRCYQIFDYVESPDISQVLGGNGKTKYVLTREGKCFRTNDFWWLNIIPVKYQSRLPVTAWWVTKSFYDKMKRSTHKCKARGCMDRYHCYRYDFTMEYDNEPYNIVPKDWVAGSERCPAYLPLLDISNFETTLHL